MRTIRRLLFALLVAATPLAAAAETYPSHPVLMMTGYPQGGTMDLMARLISQALSARLGEQIVVENRAGASGIIAADMVAKATPDGYTLLAAGWTHATNSSLYPNAPHDAVLDFTPLGMFATTPYVLVTHPSVNVRSLAELVAWIKRQPSQVYYGSAGNGTPQHLGVELLKRMANLNIEHLPYKGSAVLGPALLSGEIPMILENLALVMPHIQAGTMVPMAISSAKRAALLPDVPTIAESYPGFEMMGWFAVYGPHHMAPELARQINGEIIAVGRSPELREKLAAFGAAPLDGSPEAHEAFLIAEVAKWGKIIHDAGIQPN